MNAKSRGQLRRRKKQLPRRFDKHDHQFQLPMIRPPRATYELAGKQHAVVRGGIATLMQLIKAGSKVDARRSDSRKDTDAGWQIGHLGSNRGWEAAMMLRPDSGDGLIMLTNGSNGQQVQRPIFATWARFLRK